MSQDSKVLSRAFLGIGLILLVISAIIFYYHFTFTKSAVHTEGIIVDAVWYNNHSNDVDDNGSLVSSGCLSPYARLHANFQFEYR